MRVFRLSVTFAGFGGVEETLSTAFMFLAGIGPERVARPSPGTNCQKGWRCIMWV